MYAVEKNNIFFSLSIFHLKIQWRWNILEECIIRLYWSKPIKGIFNDWRTNFSFVPFFMCITFWRIQPNEPQHHHHYHHHQQQKCTPIVCSLKLIFPVYLICIGWFSIIIDDWNIVFPFKLFASLEIPSHQLKPPNERSQFTLNRANSFFARK